jgi:hypothetical protein
MKLKSVIMLVGACGLMFSLQGCGGKKSKEESASSGDLCLSKVDGSECLNFSNAKCTAEGIKQVSGSKDTSEVPACSVKKDSEAYGEKIAYKWIIDNGGKQCLKSTMSDEKTDSKSGTLNHSPLCMDYKECGKTMSVKLLKMKNENTVLPLPCPGTESEFADYMLKVHSS